MATPADDAAEQLRQRVQAVMDMGLRGADFSAKLVQVTEEYKAAQEKAADQKRLSEAVGGDLAELRKHTQWNKDGTTAGGLPNFKGNVKQFCFANSTIQLLAACTAAREAAFTIVTSEPSSIKETQLVVAYAVLAVGQKSAALKLLAISALAKAMPMFEGFGTEKSGEQQDAGMFLLCCLQALGLVAGSATKSTLRCVECQSVHTVIEEDKQPVVTMPPTHVSVSEGISAVFRSELASKCENAACRKHRQAATEHIKSTHFKRTPDVLGISIKRAQQHGRKASDSVSWQPSLALGSDLLNSHSGQPRYMRLIGMMTHEGLGIGSGHWKTTARRDGPVDLAMDAGGDVVIAVPADTMVSFNDDATPSPQQWASVAALEMSVLLYEEAPPGYQRETHLDTVPLPKAGTQHQPHGRLRIMNEPILYRGDATRAKRTAEEKLKDEGIIRELMHHLIVADAESTFNANPDWVLKNEKQYGDGRPEATIIAGQCQLGKTHDTLLCAWLFHFVYDVVPLIFLRNAGGPEATEGFIEAIHSLDVNDKLNEGCFNHKIRQIFENYMPEHLDIASRFFLVPVARMDDISPTAFRQGRAQVLLRLINVTHITVYTIEGRGGKSPRQPDIPTVRALYESLHKSGFLDHAPLSYGNKDRIGLLVDEADTTIQTPERSGCRIERLMFFLQLVKRPKPVDNGAAAALTSDDAAGPAGAKKARTAGEAGGDQSDAEQEEDKVAAEVAEQLAALEDGKREAAEEAVCNVYIGEVLTEAVHHAIHISATPAALLTTGPGKSLYNVVIMPVRKLGVAPYFGFTSHIPLDKSCPTASRRICVESGRVTITASDVPSVKESMLARHPGIVEMVKHLVSTPERTRFALIHAEKGLTEQQMIQNEILEVEGVSTRNVIIMTHNGGSGKNGPRLRLSPAIDPALLSKFEVPTSAESKYPEFLLPWEVAQRKKLQGKEDIVTPIVAKALVTFKSAGRSGLDIATVLDMIQRFTPLLPKEGGSPVIIIISGTVGSRGITFKSSDRKLHLTDEFLSLKPDSNQQFAIQLASRICGKYVGDPTLHLWAPRASWDRLSGMVDFEDEIVRNAFEGYKKGIPALEAIIGTADAPVAYPRHEHIIDKLRIASAAVTRHLKLMRRRGEQACLGDGTTLFRINAAGDGKQEQWEALLNAQIATAAGSAASGAGAGAGAGSGAAAIDAFSPDFISPITDDKLLEYCNENALLSHFGVTQECLATELIVITLDDETREALAAEENTKDSSESPTISSLITGMGYLKKNWKQRNAASSSAKTRLGRCPIDFIDGKKLHADYSEVVWCYNLAEGKVYFIKRLVSPFDLITQNHTRKGYRVILWHRFVKNPSLSEDEATFAAPHVQVRARLIRDSEYADDMVQSVITTHGKLEIGLAGTAAAAAGGHGAGHKGGLKVCWFAYSVDAAGKKTIHRGYYTDTKGTGLDEFRKDFMEHMQSAFKHHGDKAAQYAKACTLGLLKEDIACSDKGLRSFDPDNADAMIVPSQALIDSINNKLPSNVVYASRSFFMLGYVDIAKFTSTGVISMRNVPTSEFGDAELKGLVYQHRAPSPKPGYGAPAKKADGATGAPKAADADVEMKSPAPKPAASAAARATAAGGAASVKKPRVPPADPEAAPAQSPVPTSAPGHGAAASATQIAMGAAAPASAANAKRPRSPVPVIVLDDADDVGMDAAAAATGIDEDAEVELVETTFGFSDVEELGVDDDEDGDFDDDFLTALALSMKQA